MYTGTSLGKAYIFIRAHAETLHLSYFRMVDGESEAMAWGRGGKAGSKRWSVTFLITLPLEAPRDVLQ